MSSLPQRNGEWDFWEDCKGKFLYLEDLSNQETNQKTGSLSPGCVVGDTERSLLCVFKLQGRNETSHSNVRIWACSTWCLYTLNLEMAELFWAQSESCGFKNMPTVFLSSAPRLLKISPAVARGTRQSQNLLPDRLIPPKEGETPGVAVLVTPGDHPSTCPVWFFSQRWTPHPSSTLQSKS